MQGQMELDQETFIIIKTIIDVMLKHQSQENLPFGKG